MKRIITLAIASAIVLAGCGSSGSSNQPSDSKVVQDVVHYIAQQGWQGYVDSCQHISDTQYVCKIDDWQQLPGATTYYANVSDDGQSLQWEG